MVENEWLKYVPGILKSTKECTPKEAMNIMKLAIENYEKEKLLNYWTTEEGQSKLLEMIKIEEKKKRRDGLSVLQYTKASLAKASLSSASETNAEEWMEVELTTDTGACDTVIPKGMCSIIPIVPSAQSERGMEYEVANGQSIKN